MFETGGDIAKICYGSEIGEPQGKCPQNLWKLEYFCFRRERDFFGESDFDDLSKDRTWKGRTARPDFSNFSRPKMAKKCSTNRLYIDIYLG